MKSMISMFVSIILLITITGCRDDNSNVSSQTDSEKLKVVATTTMITDLVEIIGGDKVEVDGLMGSGIDPHLYKASAGDVNKMQNADVIFFNGIQLEGKLGDVLEDLEKSNIKTIAVSKDLDKSILIESKEFQGNFDPHIWFDVSIWSKVTETVKNTLIGLDETNKVYYEANTEKYLLELEDLNKYVKEKISLLEKDKRILITAHDAFNYFGRAYDFKVKGLQGISTASEAGTSDVKSLAEFIVEKEIPAIFIESSIPKKNVEALKEAVDARDFNVEIGGELYSDSLGEKETEDETYIGTVKHNVDTIVNALKR